MDIRPYLRSMRMRYDGVLNAKGRHRKAHSLMDGISAAGGGQYKSKRYARPASSSAKVTSS